jgi:hypothetical protein
MSVATLQALTLTSSQDQCVATLPAALHNRSLFS